MAARGYLTTHILDTARGRPAQAVAIELWRIDPQPGLVIRTVTDADGRNAATLLEAEGFVAGTYELRFHVGPYFRAAGLAGPPAFLDVVPVRVYLAAGQGHYHVPLLCSPYSYTTYRGS
jgi:5-hydroxyisourate hydrolase